MSSELSNQSNSTGQTSQSSPSNQSPQEVIGEFERKYVEKMRTLNELKDELAKAQTQVISAQSAAMDAFQQLVNCKEQYLIALVNNKQSQINSLTSSSSSSSSAPAPAPAPAAGSAVQSTSAPQRADNL